MKKKNNLSFNQQFSIIKPLMFQTMKNSLSILNVFLLSFILLTETIFAQQITPFQSNNLHDISSFGIEKNNKTRRDYNAKSYAKSGNTSKWFNYAFSSAEYVNGSTNPVIFPVYYDSSLVVNVPNGFFHWNLHAFSNTFDPASAVFSTPSNIGDVQLFSNSSYSVDSISIEGYYYRGANWPAFTLDSLGNSVPTVDTLIIEVARVPANGTIFFFTNDATDGFRGVNYSGPTNSLNYSNKQVIKIPLDDAFYADSTIYGSHITDIELPSPIIVAGGNNNNPFSSRQRQTLVTSVSFKPGYTPAFGADLFGESFYYVPLIREVAGTQPLYEPYIWNMTYVANSAVRYELSPGNWNGLYLPRLAFNPGALNEGNMEVEYKVTALTNFGFVTNEARVQVIHNSADIGATPIDIWVDDSLFFSNLNFRNATPFFDFPAETDVTISITPSGSTDTSFAVYQNIVNLTDNETYVIVANGIISPSGYTPATPFGMDVFPSAREVASNLGLTDILVHHGATDAPAVDVLVGNNLIVSNIAYSDFDGYLPAPTIDLILDIAQAGSTTPLFSFEANLATLGLTDAAITVLASGFLDPSVNSNGEGFGLWAALASGGALIELPLITPPLARVQIIHNSADLATSPVNIWFDDSLAFAGVNFRHATPFFDFPADVDVTISITDTNATDTSSAVFQATVNLDDNETYVVVANGIVSTSGYAPATPFGLDVFAGAREVASSIGETDILVYHGATDAPMVDVLVGGNPVVSNIAYSDFNGYLEVPTADLILDITAGGNPLFSYEANLSTLGLADSAITILASGFLDPSVNSNGEGFGLWVALAAGGALIELPLITPPPASVTARVQIIHNSADLAASPVNIWVEDSLAFAEVNFRNATPFIDFPANSDVTISITDTNAIDTSSATFQATVNLDENETYVVVANGIISGSGYTPSPAFGLDVFTGAREVANNPTQADILVYHGATDAPSVDIRAVGLTNPLVSDISYGEFEGYLELVVANYQITVNAAGSPDALFTYEAPLSTMNFTGNAITILASGFLDPSENSNGEEFGLYVALANGGALVPLQLITNVENNSVFGGINVYPNPSSNIVNVNIDLIENAEVNINIFDVAGKLVDAQSFGHLTSGSHLINLDVNKYSQGLYLFEISSGENRITKRFSIVK